MKNNMKRGTALAGALVAMAGVAQAGGIERSHTPYAILWENGNYAELSFGNVNPTIEGRHSLAGPSGDMTNSYNAIGLGLKYAYTDRFDLAVVFDQPVGADLTYPSNTMYPLRGSTAEVKSNAITALARYKFDGGFSVHGGVKVQRTDGEVDLRIPVGTAGGALPGGYKMKTSTETDVGYIIGAAYEKPEIALRVALTYQSAITHKFSAAETVLGSTYNTNFETEVPQSVTLDFQSGVAADTLVFGSIRWRDWSQFKIAPTVYGAPQAAGGLGAGTLVDYSDDVVTWTLGLGRKFTDNFSGAISFAYEDKSGKPTGNLGPHDGMKSVTIGGTYTHENMKITAGVSYVKVGDVTTKTPIAGRFTDNSAVGVGIKVGYSF